MIFISNNCLGGHLYRVFRKEYNCPFIWTVIDFNSMKTLITEWDNINFLNYELKRDKNWNFSIIIDNKVKIQYVHYIFEPNAVKPIKNTRGDICYNKIWEYIVSKYEERTNRMLAEKEKPKFCIANCKTIFNDAIYTEEQLNYLRKFDNVFILDNCSKVEPIGAVKMFISTFKDIFR